MIEKKQWIWQHKDYPNFTYDIEKIDSLMQSISRKQGELMALSKVIGHARLQDRQLMALENEVLSSAAIEGEFLNRESVKSSIKEKLGIETVQHYKGKTKESNYVDILLDANRNYTEPLTLEKLFSWHAMMFKNQQTKLWNIAVGAFRKEGTMQVVSGVVGKEKVFYEAPSSHLLQEEMEVYIQWFNATPASLIKTAITHLWFVTIHPFDDGNGRITRALTDRVLADIEASDTIRLYSMSKSINYDRKGYYKALEQTTGYLPKNNPMDISIWLEWFFNTLNKSLIEALSSVEYIVEKTAFWDRHKNSKLNGRQISVLNTILDKGMKNFESGLSTKKYIKITKTTSATASRDIKGLLLLGCIKQVEGTSGRNVRYEISLPKKR